MLHPVLIHHAQEDDTLQLAHDGGRDLRFLLGVVVGGGFREQVGEVLLGHGPELLLVELHGVLGEVDALHATQQVAAGGHVQMLRAHKGGVHQIGDGAVHHVHDDALDIHAVQHLLALAVDDLALLVHDIVILQHGLTGLEVAALHGGLGLLDGAGEQLVLDGGVLVDVHALHEGGDAVAAEQAHEVVLQRDVEPRLAGVALTAGTAAQLVVDTAGVVTLGADDEQAAGGAHPLGFAGDLGLVLGQLLGEQLAGMEDLLIVRVGVAGGLGDELVGESGLAQVVFGHVLGVAAQHDIRTAAGHVGGHGDGAELTGLRHDLGLALVVLGVQQVVLDALAGQHLAQQLVLLNGDGAHQHRLPLGVALLYLPDDSTVLAVLGLVDGVLVVDTGDGTVGGDLDDVQRVDGGEFLLLRQGRTGHTGQLAVQAEVVLERDGGQRLALALDGQVLLGLNGLMQTLGVPTAEHQTAGELVHDDDFAVLHHIVHVALHDAVGLDGLIDVVGGGAVLRVAEVVQMEELLRLFNAPSRQGAGAGLLVHDIVRVDVDVLLLLVIRLRHHILLQAGGEHLGHVVHLGGLFAHTGDDQRGAGLVDEDGVHLIHDGEGVAPLHLLVGVDGHVVPKVVEAHLVVGTVGDVRLIGLLPLLLGHVVDDEAHGEAHEAVHLAHPLGVALGQIVVDGDDVDALAGQRVQVGGQRGHQRLAFTGLHLGDAALMQHDAAHQLDGVGAHAQHAVGGLPHGGKCLRQDVVQRLAVLQTRLELRGLGLQLGVGQRLVGVLQRGDLIHDGIDAFQLTLAVCSENLGKQSHIFVSFLVKEYLHIITMIQYSTGDCLMQKNFCEQLRDAVDKGRGLRLYRPEKCGILSHITSHINFEKEFPP